MSLTRADLERHFPGRPESFYRANASDYIAVARGVAGTNPHRDTGQAPIVERNPRNGALGTRKTKVRDTRKFLVRVTAFRCRLLDEDNLCEKYHVDCCRYSGILPSDAAGKAKIETGQEKVSSESDERIEIVITQIE